MSKDKRYTITESGVHKGMTDVMIDLETTGLDPLKNAIAQIGAVKFNARTGKVGESFCINVDVDAMEGREWMPSTRKWWESQDKAIRDGVFENPYSPTIALNAFANWCFPLNSLRFWCKGLHFDYPFVESYFRELGIPTPFHYRQAEDMGSFIDGLYFPLPRQEVNYKDVGGAHNALSDAINQLAELKAHIAQARPEMKYEV